MQESLSSVTLTKRERDVMIEFKGLCAAGQHMGRKKIVMMQCLEDKGLVERLTNLGLIVDCRLSSAGEAWKPDLA